MPSNKNLQISSRVSDAPLSLEQQRFNFLIEQIEKLRKARAQVEASVLLYHQNDAQKLQPLRASLKAACRESVFALDRLLDQPQWSKSERVALREMLCGTADMLLAASPADAELKAVFDRHSDRPFDAGKQDDLARLKDQAEELTGLDLGDDAGILSEEDLIQRMYERMAAQEAAADDAREAAREEHHRGKTPTQKRRDDNAELARQSLREIYRKLVSALHPDREPDPVRRESKNLLMQKINRAYAANDLLTLFQTQLEIDQVDASHIGSMSTQRLKQYNKLLAEQLATLKVAIADIQGEFYESRGFEFGGDLSSQKINQLIRQQARMARAELAQQQQFLLVLADKAALKRWLKQQRRAARDADFLDDETF
ncbi:MAG TPA: J domain-containing protein [Steroidobacteraceae bacterium]